MSRLLQRARAAQSDPPQDVDGASSDSDEGESDSPAASPARQRGFSALLGSDESEEESEEASDDDAEPEEEEQRGKGAVCEQPGEVGATSERPSTPPEPRVRRGRAKNKPRAEGRAEEEEDEEEALLAAAQEQARAAAAAAAAAEQEASTWRVEPQSLNAETELRRRFGARAVRAAQHEMRQQARGLGGRGGRGRAAPRRRGLLITPKAEWPRPDAARQGGAEWPRPDAAYQQSVLGGGEGGQVLYTYQPTARHAALRRERELEMLVQHTADPQALFDLVRHEPGHVEALLQLHAVARQTGQRERAVEHLERALYSLELGFHPTFAQAWLRGEARLDYDQPANRPLFTALHLHAAGLSQRGCPAAALAAATLLLSLDRSDPTSVLLWLDSLALRAGRPHLLAELERDLPVAASLPGWAFSAALAARLAAAELPAPSDPSSAAAASAAAASASAAAASATGRLASALLAFPEGLPALLPSSSA
ncbi:hypothetical protein EMIHUDRAFT_438635, partial [Emiliania huxleyi CCMP1516]|uniref:Transcription factor 25 n=2 Tax=Emiliania huxleyi TaxID=2903 RepID=A0A0D3I6V1_EMIH1